MRPSHDRQILPLKMKGSLPAASFSDLALWLLRAVIVVFLCGGIIAASQNNPFSGWDWINLLVFGLMRGNLYALIACGYSQVTRMLSMIEFMQGEYYMAGALTATVFVAAPASESGFLIRHPGLALALITVVVMVVVALVAVAAERLAYRRLLNASRPMLLIPATGAALFWRHSFGSLYGFDVVPFPRFQLWRADPGYSHPVCRRRWFGRQAPDLRRLGLIERA